MIKKVIFKGTALALIGLFLQLKCLAWGQNGHRVVGYIAEKHLSRKAQKNISKLMGNESLAIASTWADFIKSDPNYEKNVPLHNSALRKE